MTLNKARFTKSDVQILAKDVLFEGFFKLARVQLRHRLFSGGWSQPVERELFEKALAVATVVYDPERDLVGLVEQFRVGTLESSWGPWSLEGVAGMVEEGEPPESVIRRELLEEAGLTARQLLPITGFYPTPGSCNEYTYLYCALCDLSDAGGLHGLPEEGEDILFHCVPADEVFDNLLNGRMNNAATLIGLLWLQQQRERLRAEARPQ